MSYYSLKQTANLESANDSLIIASCNLLQKFGSIVDPATFMSKIDIDLDWDSVNDYMHELYPDVIGKEGTWPTREESIVKFRCRSEKTGQPVDHYCLIASAEDKSIIDSLDGSVKAYGTYGEPLGWASYVLDNEPVDDLNKYPAMVAEAEPEDTDRLYKMLQGESIWEIARRFGIDSKELIEHNDIEDPFSLQPGTVLHMPFAIEKSTKRYTWYEIYDRTIPMHVNNADGVHKMSFGNISSEKDLLTAGPGYVHGANVNIAGKAHVPIGDDEIEFYMDSNAVGPYQTNNRVLYTVGFRASDLSDGHTDPTTIKRPLPLPTPVIQPEVAPKPVTEAPVNEPVYDMTTEAMIEAQKSIVVKTGTNVPEPPAAPRWDAFKDTYNEFPEDVQYYVRQRTRVYDFDKGRPEEILEINTPLWICGTFIKRGVEIGRLADGLDYNKWRGVFMNSIDSEDDILEQQWAESEPIHLTFSDRIFVVISKAVTQYSRIKLMIKPKQK